MLAGDPTEASVAGHLGAVGVPGAGARLVICQRDGLAGLRGRKLAQFQLCGPRNVNRRAYPWSLALQHQAPGRVDADSDRVAHLRTAIPIVLLDLLSMVFKFSAGPSG